MDVTFRVFTDDDLPLMHRWVNEPGVVRWWEGDDVSWDGVVADYGSGRGDLTTEHWIAVVDGRDTGWIQCYPADDSPQEAADWRPFGIDPSTTGGIDYLVGEPGDRGRGVGSAIIAAFVDQVVFGRHPAWTAACAAPYAANEASWKALHRAGFHLVGRLPQDGDPDGPAHLMAITRPAHP